MSNINQDRWDYQTGQNTPHEPQKEDSQKGNKKNHYNKYKESQNPNRGRDDKSNTEYLNEHQYRKHIKSKIYNKNPQEDFQDKSRPNEMNPQGQMSKKNKKKPRREFNINNVEGGQIQPQNFQTYENNDVNYEKDDYLYDDHQKKNNLQMNNIYMNTLQNQQTNIKGQKDNIQMNTMPNQPTMPNMNQMNPIGKYNMGQPNPNLPPNSNPNAKQKKAFYHNNNTNEHPNQMQIGQFGYYENPQNSMNKPVNTMQGFNPMMPQQFQYKGGFNNSNIQQGNNKYREIPNQQGMKMGYGFPYNGVGNNNQLMMTNSMMQIQADPNLNMNQIQNQEQDNMDKDYNSGEEDNSSPYGNKKQMFQPQPKMNNYPNKMQGMRNPSHKASLKQDNQSMNILQGSNTLPQSQMQPSPQIPLSISSDNQSINSIGHQSTNLSQQSTQMNQSFLSNRSVASLPNYPSEMYKPQFMPNNMVNLNEMLMNANYARMSMFGIPMGMDQNGMYGNFPFPNYPMNPPQPQQMKFNPSMEEGMMKNEKKSKGNKGTTPISNPNTNPLLNNMNPQGNMKMHMGMMPNQYMKNNMNIGNNNTVSKGSRSNQGIKNTVPNFNKSINLNFVSHNGQVQNVPQNPIQNIPIPKQNILPQSIHPNQPQTNPSKNFYKKIPYRTINSDKNIKMGNIEGMSLKSPPKQNQVKNQISLSNRNMIDISETMNNQQSKLPFKTMKLKIKLLGKDDEEIKFNINEDINSIAQKYVTKKKLDNCMIEPLIKKISSAIDITKKVLESKLTKYNMKKISEIRQSIQSQEDFSNEETYEEDSIEEEHSVSLLFENDSYEKQLERIRPSIREIEDVQLLNNSM